MVSIKRIESFENSYVSLFIMILLSVTIPHTSAVEDSKSSPSLFGKLWDIGCEFSGVVTRVRRSAPNPFPEEPNFDDPEELFNYLYPLADVKPEDSIGNGGSQRSTQSTHSLSSWLEDLMELWHSECHNRRSKRATRRKAPNSRETKQKQSSNERRVDASKYSSGWTQNSSSLFSPKPHMMGNYRDLNGGHTRRQSEYESESSYGDSETDIDPNGSYKKEELEMEIFELLEDKKKPSSTTTEQPSTSAGETETGNTTDAKPEKKEDIFFAQYGGDIEYFFPLLAFGIPFDGEITLLGFHGFRGIFPY